MKTYRAAVIGCGKIGSEFADDPNRDRIGVYSHAEAYSVCEATELVAVCDADPARARSCAERWGLSSACFTDPVEMLAQAQPDLVSICTPDPTHYDLGMTALNFAGIRGLLMEKPLALELGKAEAIVRRCHESGVKLAVNYSRRYAQSHRELKTLIDQGGIGAIQAVHGYYTKGILHNGTHWIDLLRFLAGEITTAWSLEEAPEAIADPTIDACFRMESGALALLQGCDASAFTVFEMDIVGTKGRARLIDSGQDFEIFKAEESAWVAGYDMLVRVNGPAGGLIDTTLNAVEDLAAAVTGSRPPACCGLDALEALRVAHRALGTHPAPGGLLRRESKT